MAPSASLPNISRLKARRDIKGLLEALRLFTHPQLTQEAARALESLDWKPEADEDGAAFWIARRQWGDCVRSGVHAVDPLLQFLRVSVRQIETAVNPQKAADHIASVQEAIKTLVRIGAPAVHSLIDALSDKDIFELVSEALVKIGAPALQPLLYALRDAGEYDLVDLTRVLDRLGWIPDRSEAGAYYWIGKGDLERCSLIGSAAVQPLINCFRFRSALRIRLGPSAVVDTLAQMGTVAVEPLLRALRSEHEAVCLGALEALGKIGDPRATESVQKARSLAARRASSLVQSPESVQEIQNHLVHTDWRMRRTAAEALGRIGKQEGDLKLRARILTALETAFRDTEELVRIAAVEALAELRDPRRGRILAKLLRDRSEIVRRSVVEALGSCGDGNAVRWLAGMLQDEKKGVRLAAVWALAQTGDPAAIKPLLSVMQGKDSYLCQPAAEALEKLGWKPGADSTGAAYWVARRNWEACLALGVKAVPALLHALERFRDAQGAVLILGQICLLPEANPVRRQAVQGMITCLDHYDEEMRQVAARVLVQIYPSEGLDENLKALVRSRQKDIRAAGLDLPVI